MGPGDWAKVARRIRLPVKQLAVGPGVKKGSPLAWFRRIAFVVVGSAIALGVLAHFFELVVRLVMPAGFDTGAGQRSKSSAPGVVTWSQPAAIRESMSVVPATEYAPLIGEGLAGSGFLFRVEPGIYLAATSRHQFGDVHRAPKELFNLEHLKVTLDVGHVIRLPASQVQMRSAVSRLRPACNSILLTSSATATNYGSSCGKANASRENS